MIDGGLTNPLPYDLMAGEADVIVAIDVSGAPVPDLKRQTPTAMEALFASAFLFERSIVAEKLKWNQPDILISAGTSQFQVLDFLKCDAILKAAEPAKQRLKAQLARILSVETLAVVGPSAATQPVEQPSSLTGPPPAEAAAPQPIQKRRRSLLPRRKSKHHEN